MLIADRQKAKVAALFSDRARTIAGLISPLFCWIEPNNAGDKYGTRIHFTATAFALKSMDYAYKTYTSTREDSSVHLSLAPGSGIAARYYDGQNYGYAQISPFMTGHAGRTARI